MNFSGTSTAGNANIINNSGGLLDFAFSAFSSTGTATITNNGMLVFTGFGANGTARFINGASGVIDLSPLISSGITAGSIEGAGNVFLGSRNLEVGSNNLSTTFSGVIQDGGIFAGTGGSLTKVGTGTLTLSGANTYTGATSVNAGTLSVTGSIGSPGTPSGAIGVLAGATLNVGAAGAINIGANSLTNAGTVTVQNGGTLTDFGGFVGNLPGSQGTVTVSGAGSTWTNTSNIVVGGLGTGTLTIQNGGTVNSAAGGSVGQSPARLVR